MLNQIGRQTCVFTFGYGSEHDANMLRAVADAGSGLFYYIDNIDCIPDSFCDCLGGLLSVSAQVRTEILHMASLLSIIHVYILKGNFCGICCAHGGFIFCCFRTSNYHLWQPVM